MCYSAQVWQDYRKYVRRYGADLDIAAFTDLYWQRQGGAKVRTPKAMDDSFRGDSSKRGDEDQSHVLSLLIRDLDRERMATLEQELFKQRKRLADAERSLQRKSTKTASESKRIAGDRIQWLMGQLADLERKEPADRDSRIFPGHYAPVMVWEDGRRVVKPMRYQCRVAGTPAAFDTRYPGTYNARRDSLGKFWKDLFGVSHGVVVADAFYENVSRHHTEGRALEAGEKESNVVLEFRPSPPREMLVACLWSHWQQDGLPGLLSFAAITDEPPPEVAAAGHDRCIVPIKEENLDAWLNPRPGDLQRLQAILDDRDRLYYEHRLAA